MSAESTAILTAGRSLMKRASRPIAAAAGLHLKKTDVDMEGRPIAYSETVWAGERVQSG